MTEWSPILFASANSVDNLEPGCRGNHQNKKLEGKQEIELQLNIYILTEPFNSVEKASLLYLQELTDFQISFKKIAKLPKKQLEVRRYEQKTLAKDKYGL